MGQAAASVTACALARGDTVRVQAVATARARVRIQTSELLDVRSLISFEPAALEENFRAVLDELQRAKPASAKGRYLKKISVSSTMGPGVKVDANRLKPEVTTG